MRVDLHIHTTASDGCWGPDELIVELKGHNIALFAVTDHDCIGSIKECGKLAQEAQIDYIKGVEFTTKLDGSMCHILGYNIDPDCPEIVSLCTANTNRMKQLNTAQILKIKESGLNIDLEEYKDYSFDKKRGGGMLTNFLVDKGFFKNFKESLNYVARKIDWTQPDYPTPKFAADVITRAGGTPILAHPGSKLLNDAMSEDLLDSIIDMGVKGIECYTNYHTDEQIEFFKGYCKKRGLLITAGSDCHGPLLKERILGNPKANLKDLNLTGIFPCK